MARKTAAEKGRDLDDVVSSRLRQRLPQRILDPGRHLGAIVESSDDAIISVTAAGKIASWNRAAERIYGYPAAEAIGRLFHMTVAPDRRQELGQLVVDVMAGKAVDRIETALAGKGGASVRLSLTLAPVKNAAGKVVGALAIARDVTELRLMEEALRDSQEKLRMIIDSSPGAVVVADAAMKVGLCNQAALKIAGLDSEAELVGRPAFAFVAPADHARMMADLRKKAERSAAESLVYKLRTRDGRELFLEVSARAVRDKSEEITSFVISYRDVTERKLHEEERLRREKVIRISETTIGDINRKWGVKATAAELGLEDILENFAQLNTRPAPQIIFAMLVMSTGTVLQQAGVAAAEGEVREFLAPIIRRTMEEFCSLAKEFGREIPREYLEFERALGGPDLGKLSLTRGSG